jgi:large subunit ribosomal protein L19
MIDAEIAKKIRPGAKVRVWERIKEGDKERQSAFEGIVIAHKHGVQAGATFTVRSILQEVGVEKVYPLQTPIIAKVEIISAAKKVRRSKLYYLRDLSNKKVREKLKVSL